VKIVEKYNLTQKKNQIQLPQFLIVELSFHSNPVYGRLNDRPLRFFFVVIFVLAIVCVRNFPVHWNGQRWTRFGKIEKII
jgi:hypothetical protein